MSPWWHLGEAVGELPRLLLQALHFPRRRRRGGGEEGWPDAPAGAAPGDSDASGASGAGTAFLIGGTSLTDEIVLEMIRLAGGRGARVAVLPSGSLDFARGGERYARGFRRFGVAQVEVLPLVTREQANQGELASRLEAADLIFLGGGRETLLLEVLRESAAHRAILRGYAHGKVVAGIGAGAAVLGAAVAVRREQGEATWEPGLGLLPIALLGREQVQAGQTGSLFYGLGSMGRSGCRATAVVGMDDGTALVVEKGRHAYVLGRGMAIVTLPCDGDGAAPRLLVHVLPSGYAYDLAQGERLPPRGDLRAAR